MSIHRIAVVGGGTMGNGIAHVAAQHGKEVRLLDVSPEVLEGATATIAKNLARQVEKGILDESARNETLARVETGTDLVAGVEGVDLVIEAVFESGSFQSQLDLILEQFEVGVIDVLHPVPQGLGHGADSTGLLAAGFTEQVLQAIGVFA